MKYEIDFIALQEKTKDALAVCFRYYDDERKDYVTVVYDGGTQQYGTELVSTLRQFYSDRNKPIVDLVVCSHDHDDHASGLRVILEECEVKKLIMNRPWLYMDELMDFVDDVRRTKESVERSLRGKYCYIDELEQIAKKKGIMIQSGFCGEIAPDMPFHIISPCKDFYIRQILNSRKTPCNTSRVDNFSKSGKFQSFGHAPQMKIEDRFNDSLKEEVQTEPDNETSIILYCDFEDDKVLFTGDAGKEALISGSKYANSIHIDLRDVNIYQMPHHGSRHNITPTVMDMIVGPILQSGEKSRKTAFASVSKDSDHPKKMVVNAFIRRGCTVYSTIKGYTICHRSGGMSTRAGWTSMAHHNFEKTVEDWDD